jgi:hypothetical protein
MDAWQQRLFPAPPVIWVSFICNLLSYRLFDSASSPQPRDPTERGERVRRLRGSAICVMLQDDGTAKAHLVGALNWEGCRILPITRYWYNSVPISSTFSWRQVCTALMLWTYEEPVRPAVAGWYNTLASQHSSCHCRWVKDRSLVPAIPHKTSHLVL